LFHSRCWCKAPPICQQLRLSLRDVERRSLCIAQERGDPSYKTHDVSPRACTKRGRLLSTGIGARLRQIRQQWQLSLREVEERSVRFSRERGNSSYKISAAWLNRLERETHELTVNKLIALAEVYSLPTERLLRSLRPGDPQPVLQRLSNPNATMLITEGQLGQHAKYLMLDPIHANHPSDETGFLSVEHDLSPARYQSGIIGRRDHTLEPMIPAGSIVHIDTRERDISLRKNWAHEFQRPIYFLRTRDGCVCGWCELDKDSEWLTLIPHPMSPATSRRWRYRTEIESLGREGLLPG
jgi:transcriptional regulator with XRE-family HTH domain